jgi:NADPH-dependent ferric siderophore reductase/SAM-dependent methyltransferase
MTTTTPEWDADEYQANNSGQFQAALEALMEAGAHLHVGGRFADVGCGSGELAQAMAQRDFDVTANDASPAMVAAARRRCAGLPVLVDVQDAHALSLPESSFEVVHSSWMLHWLSDAGPALRTMARAVVPGGLLVLQWSCGQPRDAGFALRDVLAEVFDRPAWRDRLAAAPLAMFQHPLDEVQALLEAEGLEVQLTGENLTVPGGDDPVSMRRALRAAAFAAQAAVLGDDVDELIDESLVALLAADALNPHNTRLIAARPPASGNGGAPRRRRPAVRAFPLSVGMLEVQATTTLSPLMRRLDLRLVDADPLPVQEPAETITLLWPADGSSPVLPEIGRWRFPTGTPPQHTANVTVRRYDADSGALTIDVFLHGGGDGISLAGWARDAQAGDRVGFAGSRVHWVADADAEWTLLFGDETALPSIAAIAETLPTTHETIAVVQVRDGDEHGALDVAGLDVRWVHRGDRPPGDQQLLEAAVRSLTLPTGRGQVWGGAEAQTIRRLRTHFLDERKLPRDQVSTQGYWHAPAKD